jgi:hypothetical protein
LSTSFGTTRNNAISAVADAKNFIPVVATQRYQPSTSAKEPPTTVAATLASLNRSTYFEERAGFLEFEARLPRT